MNRIRDWMCGRLRRRFSDYLEGTLPRRTQRMISHHLAGCGPCRHVLASLAQTIEAVRSLAADEPALESSVAEAVASEIR
jgi:predicted anti-sigma-YlaC factor YlaD